MPPAKAIRHLALLLPLSLGACGWIEPAESDMRAALHHYIVAKYGGGAQIEYLDKIRCHRLFKPNGYFCHFRLSTNTAMPLVNQGLFTYHHGWRVTELALNPKFPE